MGGLRISLAWVASTFVVVSCIGGGSRADRRGNETQPPPTAPDPQSPLEPGAGRPQLWVHGLGNPARLSAISASGVRMILNARKDLQLEGMRRQIAQYEGRDLGLVITLRWPDPKETKRPIRFDAAPTTQEERESIDTVVSVLNLAESKRMAGRLWVQFFNEVAGGPGTIMPEQADGLYDFATRAAERLRKEAPHVKIVGPGLTALDPLESASEPGSPGNLRRQGLLRAIQWSVDHADAVDIHLHCSGGEEARRQLSLLRRALAAAGKRDMPLVVLEWSPARFAARRTDLAGAQAAMADIYRAMAEEKVLIAAYAAFADTALKDTYEWANLWDAQGRPHEPFYSLYKTIAETGQPPAEFEQAAPPEDEEGEPEAPPRRNRRRG
ncbi:MAG: hypothetical protein KJZ69_11480 [Phycisphaerales bacterium]|nr:hypothetical protein [Phycisphaerales bacterium]